MIPERKIAISGPGRSGTSFLVEMFALCGFSTPPRNETYFKEVNAGLESRIDGTSPYEVDKDPVLHRYIDALPLNALSNYDALIIPIRNRLESVISRATQERFFYLKKEAEVWLADEKSEVPAGAVYRTDSLGISITQAIGLWDLVESAVRKDLPIVWLHFPRLAEDFDYLWKKIGYLLERKVSREDAHKLWISKVDRNKIHFSEIQIESEISKVNELEQMLLMLQRENKELRNRLQPKRKLRFW